MLEAGIVDGYLAGTTLAKTVSTTSLNALDATPIMETAVASTDP